MTLTLPKDFREFIQCLHSRSVRFIVIGGYAVAYHGYPRFTGDVDFFVECNAENAHNLAAAIDDFGLGSLGLTQEDFRKVGMVIQLGRPPRRIDLLTGVDGLEFASSWADREEVVLDDIPVPMLSKQHLILSKRAAGRPKDLEDLRHLEQDDPEVPQRNSAP